MTNEEERMHKLLIECPVAKHPEIFTRINGSIEALERTMLGLEKTINALEARTIDAAANVKEATIAAAVVVAEAIGAVKTIAEEAEKQSVTAVSWAKKANIKVDFFYKFLIGFAGLMSTIAIIYHLFFGG